MEGRVTFAISPSLEDTLARKILLADDSVTAQNMGRKILADAGYDVTTVNNGSAALKKIGEHKPDLIVLDVYMPGYSGLEVCQRLKDAGETARIPVLLTVGKLEPFKPEEAKRVRADGFIVKPFEASELLSAMSKLEDKVVPSPESPKPGRFARVAAALEEKSTRTEVAERDFGWKSRIAFPSVKPEDQTKTKEADASDTAIYNPVNRDLRTTIDSKPAEKTPAANSAGNGNERVDLGALATTGLPADVTSEEIAALAAAAAQMKGKVAEEPAAEAKVAEPTIPEATIVEGKIVEEKIVEEKIAQEKTAEEKTVEGKLAESKTEEAKPEPATSETPVASSPSETSQSESSEEKPAVPPFEVVATIASPEQEPELIAEPLPPAIEPSPSRESYEPVTMAVAPVSEPSASATRWTAVSVEPDPEEAALTLEQEMQRVQAPVAAAEPAPAATISEISAPDAATALPPADATAEKVDLTSLTAAPDAAPALPPADATVEKVDLTSLTAVAPDAPESFADAATEALSAAVEKLEAVADAHIEPAPAPLEAASPAQSEASTSPAAESVQTVTESSQTIEPSQETPAAVPVSETKSEQEAVAETQPAKESQEQEKASPQQESQTKEQPAEEWHESCPAQVISVADVSAALAQPYSAEDSAGETQTVGGSSEANKSEADIVATTAAAWASWRRIREAGDATPQPPADSSQPGQEMPVAQDEAAMAVAAGAEKPPEPASEPEPAPEQIATIVDGILADMRPKILEEVSRKLRNK